MPANLPLTRRGFLRLSAALTAMLGWPGGVPAGSGLRERKIPSTGERIPVVGLGTARTFDVGDSEGERAPLREVMRRFIAEGGRLIDTSPMYGTAETVIGDILARVDHPEMFYATKVWTEGREAGLQQMETSAERLRTDPIDLMQVHNLVDWRTHLDTLERWKAEGRIRYVGITHYVASAFEDLERIMRERDLDWVQLPYNLAQRGAADRLLPLAADRGIAVLVNVPFGNGALFSQVKGRDLPDWAGDFGARTWAQFFLKFILARPEVTCVIPATSDPEHVVDNVRAGKGALPSPEQAKRMARFWDSL